VLKGAFSHPFVKFVAKKIVYYGIVTFVALSLAFFIPRFMPGSAVQNWFRGLASGSVEAEQTIRDAIIKHLGLDRPWHEQYINFWMQLLRWPPDLGTSYYRKIPVATVVMEALPWTLVTVVPVLVISFFLGNWIGAKAAYIGGKPSEATYFLSVFANRLPSFWFGFLLYYVFTIRLKLTPVWGSPPRGIPGINGPLTLENLQTYLWYFTLPFLTLFIIYLGGWATGMRSMVIHEMDSGYVRYADQLGFKKSKSMAYARRNAILPQFTGINLYFNALVGETTIIEQVFGWPGLGSIMYTAAFNNDYPLVIGAIITVICIVVVGNFIIDILYGFVDPRIRLGHRW
jgi:peptide/nickel transport system permease protein